MPGKPSYAELKVRIEELEEENELLHSREKMQMALLRAPLHDSEKDVDDLDDDDSDEDDEDDD